MRTWIVLLLLLINNIATASPVSGTFTATEACSAFVSKNKKTNPGNYNLAIGTQYLINEVNKDNNPDWFRIMMPEANGLRWVHADCGEAIYQSKSKHCDLHPGLADSYVLGMSWLPGFCQSYGYEAGRPECLNLPAASFQANHLVLHGLWPNQTSCGEHYGFCGVKPRLNHCDYPNLDLEPTLATALKKYMPSYEAGSCLERHEWNKHGSCQMLALNEYFALAINLAKEVDQTPLANYLLENRGKTITRSDLEEQVTRIFGTHKKFYFGCKDGYLVDIFISLPALIPADASLMDLIERAPFDAHGTGCPMHIAISDFHRQYNSN